MVDPRTSQFWQTAVQGGLVVPAKLEECWQAIPTEKRTPDAMDRRLARQTVNAGLLTLWQAQQILAGRQNGLRIDRYLILDQIGHGGMGRVYLARDTRLRRLVAVKVLSRDRIGNPRAVSRFRREAKLGAQLQHENLIRVYDEGDIGGMPYLVMEYITGKTVSQMISEQGRLPPAEAAELGRQVALGLEHLHQKDLLHRDVNPANILVDQEGIAKLTDLGLAIDLTDEEDIVTRDGATVGTFDYISPEQARNPRQIDTRSDLYSLGCTLYHMIAGRVPFPAPSLPEKLFAHQSTNPEPLRSFVPEIPEGLEAVVATLMNKRPEDRYSRPAAAARGLEPYARRFRRSAGKEIPTPRSAEAHPGSSQLSPAGSDPELIAVVPAPASANPVDAAPAFDLKLDFGPEPSLSESLSTARSRSGSHDDAIALPIWWRSVALGLISALLLATIAVWLWPWSNSDNSAAPSIGSRPRVHARPDDAAKPFLVRLGRDNVQQEATLPEALRRASGKTAEITLYDSASIDLKLDEPLTVSGSITLKAAPGNHPIIHVNLRKPVSFLTGSAQSALHLEGIAIRVSVGSDAPSELAVIRALGNLSLDRCSIEGRNLPAEVHAIQAEGSRLSLHNCWVLGFSTALAWRAFPDSEAILEQTLLVGSGSDAWPLFVKIESTRAEKRRHLRIDHCTFVGSGLARVSGAKAAAPLEIKTTASVVVGRWLLDWQGEAFPKGLTWTGEENLFDLGGEGWIANAKGAVGSVPIGGREHKLDAFASKGQPQIKDRGSQARSVEFATMPPSSGTSPADYRLISGEGFLQPWPGVAPESLLLPHTEERTAKSDSK
jgi:serine/threonine protein kinase